MRDIWVNGKHYPTRIAFLRHLGACENHDVRTSLHKATEEGEPFVYEGRVYTVKTEPPKHNLAAKIFAPKPRRGSEPLPPRGLLARGSVTVGLHQDKGEHYA